MAKDIESIEVSVNGTRETLNLRDDRVAGLDEALSKTQALLSENEHLPGAFEAVEETLFDLVDGKLGDYAKEIVANWRTYGSLSSAHYFDKKLFYFPLVDTSNYTHFHNAFAYSNLRLIAPIDFSSAEKMEATFDNSKLLKAPFINAAKCTSFARLFLGCSNLKIAAGIDLSSATNVDYIFISCESLKSITTPLDFDTVTSANGAFERCKNLYDLRLRNTGRVKHFSCTFCNSGLNYLYGLDFSSATDCYRCFYNCSRLRILSIVNFGTSESIRLGSAFLGVEFWGTSVTGPSGRKSLIDTFLTNSFDRTAAGYKPLVVQLEPRVLSVFSDEELAAITAKGFTLTSY